MPAGYVRDGIEQALSLGADMSTGAAARLLGNGSAVTAPDTVPFCFFIAALHASDFREALWQTVSALGDRDTTCAIVGGVLANACGREWQSAREPLPYIRA